MAKAITTTIQGNAKGQVSQDVLRLRRYLVDTLCDARDFVAACLDGDDCTAFRDAAKGYLLDAAKTLRSLQITDGGKTWQRVNQMAPFADIQRLVADPQNFRTLYLAAREFYDHKTQRLYLGGVFKVAMGAPLGSIYFPSISSALSLSTRSTRKILFAATTDHPYHDHCIGEGVLVSKDGGRTWCKENTGLTHRNISCLRLHPLDPSILLAGTLGNGAFLDCQTF